MKENSIMSIPFQRNITGFERIMNCAYTSKFQPPAPPPPLEVDEEDWGDSTSATTTTSSSSIGRNSDDVSGRSSSDGGDSEENDEVQSSYKGPLNMMNSLDQVLPMRRSISSFYNGKSKSYTSLADASSTSIKDLAKPENAYTRRRRNLLAINHIWEKNKNKRLIRPISSCKSSLALAVAMSGSETDSFSSTGEDSSSTLSPRLPPLYPQRRTDSSNNNCTPSSSPPSLSGRNLSNWRSFSLVDVRECN